MKKVFYLIAVIVLVLAINSLIHSIYDLWHKQDLLTNAQNELEREKDKNQKLKAEYARVQTQEFLEEEAHNKLFLSKPGEQKLLISEDLSIQNEAKKQKKTIANWEKWVNLFF